MPPSGQYGPCLHHRGDKRLSEGLVTEPAIKAPDERVLGWLIWRSPMHSTWRSCNQRRIEVDVSSVPLALTNASGLPRIAAVASISCAPLAPDSDVSGTNARHSRLTLSTTHRTRKRRPQPNASETKYNGAGAATTAGSSEPWFPAPVSGHRSGPS